MKKILVAAVCLLTTTLSFAQKATWKEMHDFHAVMSKTFHPAEDNNLQPLKDSAAILTAKAKAWQTSVAPAGYNASITKPILKKLVKQCAAIEKAVAKNTPDAELKKQITAAHETFHEIMEKCSTEEKH